MEWAHAMYSPIIYLFSKKKELEKSVSKYHMIYVNTYSINTIKYFKIIIISNKVSM